MKSKNEILEKVSGIIDTSKDEQVILNASHFLYGALVQIEAAEKMEAEKAKQKELAKKRAEKMKNSNMGEMFSNLLAGDVED